MLGRGDTAARCQRAAEAGRPTRGRWPLVAATIGVAAFLTTIDSTILNVALPSIQRGLQLPLPVLQWVVTSYLLTFAALMLAGGRLADRFGRRRILLIGLGVFTAASVPAAAARDAAMLLAARGLQGAGAALVLPVGLAGLGLGWLAVPESVRPGAERLDLAGLLSAVVTLAAATFALLEGPTLSWGSPAVAGAGAVACAGAACFGWAERHSHAPMVDFTLLRERALAGGIAASVLWGAGVNGVFFFTSLFLQRAAGFSASRTGLVFVPIAVLVILVSPLAPGLVGRFGAARVSAAGLMLVAVGLAAVSLTRHDVTLLRLLPGVAIIGVGSALTVPLTSSALAAVPEARAGLAGGLLGVAREAAGLVGISVIGLIVTSGQAVPAHGRLGGAFVAGYGTGLMAAAGLVALGAVIAWRTLPAAPPD